MVATSNDGTSRPYEPVISITMITEVKGTLATPAKKPPMPTMSAATGSGDNPGTWSDATLPNAAPSAPPITSDGPPIPPATPAIIKIRRSLFVSFRKSPSADPKPAPI
jgi:hypothetical protein